MTNYVHPPNSKGLQYPGPVEFTQFDGAKVITGYHAEYIMAVFDERLRLSRSVIQIRILAYHHVVAVAFRKPGAEDYLISLDFDWVSAIGLARNFVEDFDDEKYGPVEGEEEFRALQRKMN
jgi:hypothetical protein